MEEWCYFISPINFPCAVQVRDEFNQMIQKKPLETYVCVMWQISANDLFTSTCSLNWLMYRRHIHHPLKLSYGLHNLNPIWFHVSLGSFRSTDSKIRPPDFTNDVPTNKSKHPNKLNISCFCNQLSDFDGQPSLQKRVARTTDPCNVSEVLPLP